MINASVLSIGVSVSLTGIVISSLRESEYDISLTKDEESWFGKELKSRLHTFYCNFIYMTTTKYEITVKYSPFIL